LESDFLIR